MTYFSAGLALAIWVYLVAARGRFWLCMERHDRTVPSPPDRWPSVTAVIPARDEAETIATAVGSLLRQNYAGLSRLILVDDGSSDGTADAARAAAAEHGAEDRLTVINGGPPPAGWTGKLWALQQGFEAATSSVEQPDFLLLTDADIAHGPSAMSALVSRAVDGGHVLTSVMARLRCRSFAERCAIPAFVYFFEMLYPFAWVNRENSTTAAAAGGCILVRSDALKGIGGFRSISDALIDDCALARRLSGSGPIWLGLSDEIRSIRSYDGFGSIARMVERSAYAELDYSPLRLLAAMLAMAFIFLAPPFLVLVASGGTAVPAILACALMVLSFQPILRFYGLSPLWGFALPAIAVIYMAWTVRSALQHASGRGGEWKGRFQATAGGAR